MSVSANVSPNAFELAAAQDAAPVMLEVLEAFVLAHHNKDGELLAKIAVTAQEVVTIVKDTALRAELGAERAAGGSDGV